MCEVNENLVYPSHWDFKSSFACRKILVHGSSGSTSHLKEVLLRIFNALKKPWPGSNQQPLGPVTSTLTITPPRQHRSPCSYVIWGVKNMFISGSCSETSHLIIINHPVRRCFVRSTLCNLYCIISVKCLNFT
jgi:hypothetical protein